MGYMTTADEQRTSSSGGRTDFDPNEYRMTIGEHLEELRGRLILGLMGFVVAACITLPLGKRVINVFCRPLTNALWRCNMNPQMYYREAAEPFMVYMNISLISAGVLASPWLLYQLWKFVAAG